MVIILLLLLLSLTEAKANPIGEFIQLTGPAQVDKKAGSSVDVSLGFKVESLDTIRTARARANIKFKDETQVAITENSKLVIDEYVYDPNRGAGKMSMKIALGTVRYASGAIAKNNNENINIQTPVATVGVRGTSFSMTVDEIGQSLVILLPNRDGTVGEIRVESDAGQVILNKAFQSTYVSSSEGRPAQPTILNILESQINNLLIVSKPEKSKDEDTDIFNGNDNEVDVLNTMLSVQNRLYEILRRGDLFTDSFQVDGNPTLEPFAERFENYLAGWTMTFDILVPNEMTVC